MSIKTQTHGSPRIQRLIDLSALLSKKSHFLFGPRQTGKSFLINQSLPDVRVYDLLDTSIYLALSQNPLRLSQELRPKDRIVVIDEIQRLPDLLNEVHRLIETRRIKFLLTGSSARKLRRGGVNLLGGRARTKHLHPLTYKELGKDFNLSQALTRGTLPSIYFSDDSRADLQSYAGTYLEQEIVAEGATRNVPAFSRFLKVAALCNGTMVNFTNVAGYDPRGVNIDMDPSNDFLGMTYDPDRLIIKADLNGNGLIVDANESIMFLYDSKTYTLRRNTGGGNQPFGENIESFLVEYFDQGGNPTVDSASIQQVKITVTARTEAPDHKYVPNGGYRTVTLQSRLTPRNL